jgi:uncharacterized protein (DUF433 family)
MMSDEPKKLIDIRKRTSGGMAAYVGKSRVRVSDIAAKYELALQELAVKRIHQAYPHLTIEEIEAAILYWRENSKEIKRNSMRKRHSSKPCLPTSELPDLSGRRCRRRNSQAHA